MFSRFFNNTVYIKVHPDHFELRHVETGKSVREETPPSFHLDGPSPEDQAAASLTLAAATRRLFAGKMILSPPVVLIQPVGIAEGALGERRRALLEKLAMDAGARRARVWAGAELADDGVLEALQA